MGFSVVAKFIALSATAVAVATPLVTSVSIAPFSRDSSSKQQAFLTAANLTRSSQDIKCYIVETTPKVQERLLACTNKKYYLHNLNDDSLLELKDLEKYNDNEISSILVKEDDQEKKKNWTVVGDAWKNLPKNATLGLGDNLNPNGNCNLESVVGSGAKMQRALVCKHKNSRFPITINVTPLKNN